LVERKNLVVEAPAEFGPRFFVVSFTAMVDPGPAVLGAETEETTRSMRALLMPKETEEEKAELPEGS
jgi:hypothetical protein